MILIHSTKERVWSFIFNSAMNWSLEFMKLTFEIIRLEGTGPLKLFTLLTGITINTLTLSVCL